MLAFHDWANIPKKWNENKIGNKFVQMPKPKIDRKELFHNIVWSKKPSVDVCGDVVFSTTGGPRAPSSISNRKLFIGGREMLWYRAGSIV